MTGNRPSEELLRAAGLASTRQRVALLNALGKARKPQSVAELSCALAGDMNMTTVYRNLRELVGAGLARRLELGENHARYEAAGTHHHHVVCRSCSTIADVALCLPEGLARKARAAASFARVDDHALEFFGVCKACAKDT